jgi:pSer/pThr/pTyr-binding forkhead associated (FHA) protein
MALPLDAQGDPLARHSLSPSELKELLTAERLGRPFLVFRDQQGRLTLAPIGPDGRSRTVGRRPETDISISWDNEVSALHAELQGLGGEWTIADDGLSRNGTFVNGRRVTGRQRLREGDRIRVGQTTLVYKMGSAPRTESTASAGAQPSPRHLTETQRRVLVALCRPYGGGDRFAPPATNQQIAAELFLSVEAIKMHLRTLFVKFGLSELPQNEKRARLAECAVELGLVTPRDLV